MQRVCDFQAGRYVFLFKKIRFHATGIFRLGSKRNVSSSFSFRKITCLPAGRSRINFLLIENLCSILFFKYPMCVKKIDDVTLNLFQGDIRMIIFSGMRY